MATSPEAALLKNILDTLTSIQKESKKTASSNSASVKAASSAVSVDASSIKQLGDSLKILGQAIIPITKISDKDIDKVTNIIKRIADTMQSIVLDKEQISAFYMMAGAFKQMSEVVDGMSKNFFRSFFKFGPVQAHLIGKRMSRFYKIILGYLAGALKEVMNPISTIQNPEELKQKINAMTNLAKLLIFDVKPADLKKIVEMGLIMTEKRGRRIAKFYTSLIEELSKADPDGKTTARAIDLVKSITKLIGLMTVSFIAILAVTVFAPVGKVIGALLILGTMVTGIYILMKKLASEDFKKASKGMMWGLAGITMLIVGLTLSLTLLTAVSAKYEPKQIGLALALFVTVSLVSAGLIWLLSKENIKKSSIESLITVSAILALFTGLSLSMMLAMKLGEKGKETLAGGLLVTAFTLIGIFLIKALSKISVVTLGKGLISTAAISLMIIGISASMILFSEFLRKLNGLTDKTILWGIGLTLGMVAGMGAIAFAAGALVFGPQALLFAAGVAAVESIALMIGSISSAMLLFTGLLKEVKGLQKEDIQDAVSKLTMEGGMVDALRTIIDTLDDFGVGSAIKVAAIGKSLQPVISTISQFVDVIQKMASMKIADEWDANGKPKHYMLIKPEDFKIAAINLSKGFSTFVTELGNAFKTIDRKARKNMKKLSGPIGLLIQGVASLIQPIMELASGKVQIGNNAYDVDILKLMSASKGIANSVISLIDPLNDLASKDIEHGEIRKIFKTFKKSMKHLFNIFEYASKSNILLDNKLLEKLDILTQGGTKITDFLNVISLDMAAKALNFKIGMIHFGNGVKELLKGGIDIKSFGDTFKTDVSNLVDGLNIITAFLGTTDFSKINGYDVRRFLRTTQYSGNAVAFEKVMMNFVKGVKHLLNDEFDIRRVGSTFRNDSTNIVYGLQYLTEFMINGKFDVALRRSRDFKDTMHHTADGLKYIKPYLIASPKEIIDLSNAIKQLDVELIEKEEKRAKAIQSVSSNFKDMAQNIEMLNKSLNNSVHLASVFNKMKDLTSQKILTTGANAIVDATVKVKDTVESITTKQQKPQEKQEQEKQKQEQMNNNLASTIANAITIALSQWAEDHKDITIRLGEDGQTIFGSAYYS